MFLVAVPFIVTPSSIAALDPVSVSHVFWHPPSVPRLWDAHLGSVAFWRCEGPLGEFPTSDALAQDWSLHVVERNFLQASLHAVWLPHSLEGFREGVLVDVVLVVKLWLRVATRSLIQFEDIDLIGERQVSNG